MVINDEIKFPRVTVVDPFIAERQVNTVDGVNPVHPIGAYLREWQRRRRGAQRTEREAVPLPVNREKAVKRLIARVNEHFDQRQIKLRLVLTKEDDGYTLDVYDCASDQASTIIRDIVIGVDELPHLLRNLQDEAGILIDTVS